MTAPDFVDVILACIESRGKPPPLVPDTDIERWLLRVERLAKRRDADALQRMEARLTAKLSRIP